MAMNKERKEMVMSIHRHWMWAERLRGQFYSRLGFRNFTSENIKEIFLSDCGIYMCLWYGLLNAVVEALEEEQFCVTIVQNEIAEIRDSLRLFRNAVFHVQGKYWSEKLIRIMEQPGSAKTILRVHEAIGQWLLDEIRQNT